MFIGIISILYVNDSNENVDKILYPQRQKVVIEKFTY